MGFLRPFKIGHCMRDRCNLIPVPKKAKLERVSGRPGRGIPVWVLLRWVQVGKDE